MFFVSGSVLISQDELDTWTLHTPIALDTDVSHIDPIDTIYKGLEDLFPVLPLSKSTKSSFVACEGQ